MNSPMTTIYILAPLFGFAVSWTASDLITPPTATLPPAIQINEMVIRDDGSTIYDRTVLEPGIWQAWSGQIFDDENGRTLHCRGGDLAQYHGPLPDAAAHDVDWLVGDDCLEGLKAGMRFSFTWTPIGPDFSPVRYPEAGYGTVIAAE